MPYQYTDLRVNGRIVIRGMPQKENSLHPRLLTAEEIRTTIFRHYSTPAGAQAIRSAHQLVAGPVSYVASPYIYTDLTGVFFTDQNTKQEDVGLSSSIHSAYVDVKIDPRLIVIRLERGIYLVPGPSEVPAWMTSHLQNAKVGDPYYDEKLVRDQVGYHALVVPFMLLN